MAESQKSNIWRRNIQVLHHGAAILHKMAISVFQNSASDIFHGQYLTTLIITKSHNKVPISAYVGTDAKVTKQTQGS
jgi:hypothetical protein